MSRDRSFHELYPATSLLLLVNLAFFALSVIGAIKLARQEIDGSLGPLLDVRGDLLRRLGALYVPAVRDGELWRLLSAAFLHGNLLHIFFNGMFLLDAGRQFETKYSVWRFVTLYVCSALGGSLLSLSVRMAGLWRPFSISVGASGALCGLVGFLFIRRLRTQDPTDRAAAQRMVIWLVMISVLMPRIDHFAHLGGFIVGVLFGWRSGDYTSSQQAQLWRWPGHACAGLVAVSLVAALWSYFRPWGP